MARHIQTERTSSSELLAPVELGKCQGLQQVCRHALGYVTFSSSGYNKYRDSLAKSSSSKVSL